MRYALALLAFFVMPARAAPGAAFPIVDVDAFCLKASPREPVGRAACVRQEQIDYEYAKSLWVDLSPRGQAYCAEMMRTASGAEYRLLASCVQGTLGNEQNERDRVVTPRFRP